jgi:hypothetical protein
VLELDRTILFRTYRQMSVVKQKWIDYLSVDLNSQTGSVSEDSNAKEISAWDEEATMWNTIMTNIKKMLVAAH